MRPAPPPRRRFCTATLPILILWSGSVVGAQVLDLGGGPALPARAGIGDTLEVGLRVDAAGRRLTSVSLALQYDPNILRPVGTGSVYVPDTGFFPRAVIYENRIVYEDRVIDRAVADGGSASARARFVAVAGTASDGVRPTMSGEGILATIRFVVVGFADSAHILLVTEGADRPLYTELGRPGVEAGFGVVEPRHLSVELDRTGFLPLPDVDVDAGRVVALGLRRRTADRMTWSARSRSPDLVDVRVQGDSLLLETRPRTAGTAVIDYLVLDVAGNQVGTGQLNAIVIESTRLLADSRLETEEDSATERFPLDGFLEPGIQLPSTVTWEASVSAPLTGGIDGDDLVLSAPAQWWGEGTVTLRLRSGRDLLDTLQVTIRVAPVNDRPRLQLPTSALTAISGVRTVGPPISDWLTDLDDDVEDLVVGLVGDGVDAWEQDGRLQLRGVRTGVAFVHVRVTDPAGASDEGTLLVEVVAASVAPMIVIPADPVLAPGQRLAVALDELVVDAPDLDDLDIVVLTSGMLWAVVVADSIVLTAGAGTSAAAVHFTVTDMDGNTASGLWPVSIVEDTDVSDVDGSTASDLPGAIGGDKDISESGGGPTSPIDASAPIEPDSPVDHSANDDDLSEAADPFGFAQLPRLTVRAGEAVVLDVAGVVEPQGSGRAYSVAGATFVDVEIDGDTGRLVVTAAPGTAGREVLLLWAADNLGRVATATVEVLVTSAAAGDALRLRALPEVTLDSGGQQLVDLGSFVDGAQGEVTWSATPDGDLVSASMDGDLLRLRAGAEVGRATVLIAAQDEAGRRASELLHVQVDAQAPDGPTPLRLLAPPALTLAPGGKLAVDLRTLVDGEEDVFWSIADDAGLIVTLTGDTLYVEAGAVLASGWREVALQARTAGGTVTLRFPVAVVATLRLVLRPAPDVVVVAGLINDVLDVDDLVSIGEPDSISWSVGGGVLLRPTLTSQRRLVIDASDALPGREVLQVTAAFAGETRRLSVSVRVRAPVVALNAPDSLLLWGRWAALAIDDWVQGEIPATALEWQVGAAPEGVTATWDESERRLRLAGAGVGDLRLQARLASGLQVVSAVLPVRLQAPAGDDDTEPVGQAETPVVWSLRQPPLPVSSSGDTVLVRLASLVEGVTADALEWSVHAEGGRARIIAGQLELSGTTDFLIVIETTHRSDPDGGVVRLEMLVPVRLTPAAVPVVDLVWDLADGDRPGLRVRADADADVILTLEVTIQGETTLSQELISGVSVRLPLPSVPKRIGLVARGRRLGTVGVDSVSLRVGWFVGAGELAGPDSVLIIGVPAGIPGGIAVAMAAADEVGAVTIVRAGAAGVLSIRALDGDSRWTALQERTAAGWQDLPGAWRTESGMRAFTDSQPGTTVLRPVAAAVTDAALEAVSAGLLPGPFPNPFNASVTLPIDTDSRRLRIYDATGRVVRTYELRAGTAVHWNGLDAGGRRVASGVYFYRLFSGHRAGPPGKLTLLR